MTPRYHIALLWTLLAAPALAQPSSKVLVVEAELRELPSTIRLVGTVRPARKSIIGSEVAGVLAIVPVREGDFVEQGQVLCQLDENMPRLDVDAARGELESLIARLDIAKAELGRWTKERERVAGLQQGGRAQAKELYDTEADYLGAEARVREAEHKIQAQQAILGRAETNLRKATIVAPFNGYISRLLTEVGQWLPLGGDVVELIDLDTVLVRVDAPESAIPYLHVGDPAPVLLDAVHTLFTGHIRHIIPQGNELARTFPVDIEIHNTAHQLRAGMFGRATVRNGPIEPTVAVLKDAVVIKHGTANVWRVEESQRGAMATPTAVTLGAEFDEWIAITSGNVEPGMLVAVRGNEALMPFPSPVIVVDEPTLLGDTPAVQPEPPNDPGARIERPEQRRRR